MFRCCTPHQISFIRSILSFPVLNVRRPFDGVVFTPRSTAHGTPRINLLCRPLLSSPDLPSALLSMISSPRLTSISTSPFLLIFTLGRLGKVVSYDPEAGRYLFQIETAKQLKLRRQNVLAGPL